VYRIFRQQIWITWSQREPQ